MNSLFILNETYTNGYRMEVLDFISLVSILCGIFVIVSKNPIISVLYLIGLFLSISCYLIILGLNFIGLSYLLVYIGAVSILFLFILMLINVRISELQSNSSNGLFLSFIVGISFYSSVVSILPIKLNLKRNIYWIFRQTIITNWKIKTHEYRREEGSRSRNKTWTSL